MRHALVTGDRGFLGRHLLPELLKRGFEVSTLDSANGKDITDLDSFSGLPPSEVVFHLAGITFVPKAMENPFDVFRVNLLGTLNVLEYCRKCKARLIFPSSYVYGHPKYLPIDENHPTNPNNPYTQSKFLAEQLCQSYAQDFGCNCVILRLFNVYGPGQREEFLIPTIVKQIHSGDKIVLKDLKPKRDYVHVSDVISAFLAAAEYGKKGFEVFNIGSGESHSVKEIAEKLALLSNKKKRIYSLKQERLDEILDCVADIRKAKTLLKWQPLIVFEEGLKSLLCN